MKTILQGVLLVMVATAAAAQVPAGPEFRVNSYTTGLQIASGRTVAILPSGSFVVVWQDGGSDVDIFAQRFEANGAPAGAEFRVNEFTTSVQSNPRVAAVRDPGGFVIVWSSLGQDGNSQGAFARIHDAAGQPLGVEFRVNEYTPDMQWARAVAAGPRGSFVVAWESHGQDGSGYSVLARPFDRHGTPLAPERAVNTWTTGFQTSPSVAIGPDGGFLVAWTSQNQDGSDGGVYARRFDAGAAPLGGELRVNDYTTGPQGVPSVAMDARGNAVVGWTSAAGSLAGAYARRYDAAGNAVGSEFRLDATGDMGLATIATDDLGDFLAAFHRRTPAGDEVRARRFRGDGTPIAADFLVNTSTPITTGSPGLAVDGVGNFVVAWSTFGPVDDVFAQRYGGLRAAALRVDTAGNGMLEPGESALAVRPSWENLNGSAQMFGGQISNPIGPPGGVPVIGLLQALYGTVPNGATGECTSCYTVHIPLASPRPALHWDGSVDERVLPMALGQQKRWTLHVGNSFTDVLASSVFYRFVETLLHHDITGGCSASEYCPSFATTREQMAVFVLVAKEGAGYVPQACGATPMFADVPASSPFCRWIEELARRGVAGGCGGGNYCPTASVTREQMAVFVLRTLDAALDPPACGAPRFADVPAASPFCRWIEELARRGVVTGCGGGNYCPAAAVTREQMGVFIALTFGLALYGP